MKKSKGKSLKQLRHEGYKVDRMKFDSATDANPRAFDYKFDGAKTYIQKKEGKWRVFYKYDMSDAL